MGKGVIMAFETEASRLVTAAENQDGATFKNIMGEVGSCHWKELIAEANRILKGTGGHPAADFSLRTEDLIDLTTGNETVTVRKVGNNNAPNSSVEPPPLAIVEDTTCKEQDKALDLNTAVQGFIAAANKGDGIAAAHTMVNFGFSRIPTLIEQANNILAGNTSGWAARDYRLGTQGFLDGTAHKATDTVLQGEQKDRSATVHYVNPYILATVRYRTDGQSSK
jgi:hypothetical protein